MSAVFRRHLQRSAWPLAAALLAGCGTLPGGRLAEGRPNPGALESAVVDLSIQQKLLKQELALAHRETDTLRSALERSGGGDASRRLEETVRELAQLRVSYAKLQAEHGAANLTASATDPARVEALEGENTRLRRELEIAREENATLAEKLKASLAEQAQAEARVAQLDRDVLAQSTARSRAEQANLALRAQLEAVMARAGRTDPVVPATPVAPPADISPALAALREAKAPPSDALATVELRANRRSLPAELHPLPPPSPVEEPAVDAPPASASAPPGAPEYQTYTVQAGDTLEKLSLRFYGVPDQWARIYDANSELFSSGQGLQVGGSIRIPAR